MIARILSMTEHRERQRRRHEIADVQRRLNRWPEHQRWSLDDDLGPVSLRSAA